LVAVNFCMIATSITNEVKHDSENGILGGACCGALAERNFGKRICKAAPSCGEVAVLAQAGRHKAGAVHKADTSSRNQGGPIRAEQVCRATGSGAQTITLHAEFAVRNIGATGARMASRF